MPTASPYLPLLFRLGLLSMLSIVSGCDPSSTPTTTSPQGTMSTLGAQEVEIRYSAFGIPHIRASNYRSLGFGVGVVHAEHNLCTLAEQLVKLRGEKARYLGPGRQQANILSDLAYQALDYTTAARTVWPTLSPDVQALLQGYVQAFNVQLSAKLRQQNLPSPCANVAWIQAPWLTKLTGEDLLAYHLDLASLASARNFHAAIAVAAPPNVQAAAPLTTTAASLTTSAVPLATSAARPDTQMFTDDSRNHMLRIEGIGSNGWALGKEKTDLAQSALLANPHFPWDGELRFFMQHLTIDGELDVAGATMIGMPAVLIGFNQQIAWTHTVSQAKRFTLYQLQLDPANPLRYKYGDSYRELTAKKIRIEVLQANGERVPLERTLYFSHYGPMLNLASLSPSLGWSTQSAVTFRDANALNGRLTGHWLALGKAKNVEQALDSFAQHQGIPWVNTLAVDASGHAAYIDGSQVPLLSETAERYWAQASQSPQLAAIWQDGAGSVLLPGSDPRFEWQQDARSKHAGTVPAALAPKLIRNDYLFNANSSHWLSNLSQPLEGYSLMYGPERTERSPRTRYNAQLITNSGHEKLAGSDGKFTFAELKNVFSNNGSIFALQERQSLVRYCQQTPTVQLAGRDVDLSRACTVLAGWDGRYLASSQGAILMREFLANYRIAGERNLSSALYQRPFDSKDPAHTPAGLSDNQSQVLQALALAVVRLQNAGIAFDSPLGQVQFLQKTPQSSPIPLAGGYSFEGVFNMAERLLPSRSTSELVNVESGQALLDAPTLSQAAVLAGLNPNPSNLVSQAPINGQATAGYRVNYGSSFVMAVQFTNQNGVIRPEAEVLHAYGQAHDPASVHFNDTSSAFSQHQWHPLPFRAQQVQASTVRRVVLQVPSE
jgi:acyl-homoserine-lactone acylase